MRGRGVSMAGGMHGKPACMARGRVWLERRPLQRTVSILLQCILVLFEKLVATTLTPTTTPSHTHPVLFYAKRIYFGTSKQLGTVKYWTRERNCSIAFLEKSLLALVGICLFIIRELTLLTCELFSKELC